MKRKFNWNFSNHLTHVTWNFQEFENEVEQESSADENEIQIQVENDYENPNTDEVESSRNDEDETQRKKRSVDEKKRVFKSCKCLPACSSIKYNAEVTQSDVNLEKHMRASDNFDFDKDEFE